MICFFEESMMPLWKWKRSDYVKCQESSISLDCNNWHRPHYKQLKVTPQALPCSSVCFSLLFSFSPFHSMCYNPTQFFGGLDHWSTECFLKISALSPGLALLPFIPINRCSWTISQEKHPLLALVKSCHNIHSQDRKTRCKHLYSMFALLGSFWMPYHHDQTNVKHVMVIESIV